MAFDIRMALAGGLQQIEGQYQQNVAIQRELSMNEFKLQMKHKYDTMFDVGRINRAEESAARERQAALNFSKDNASLLGEIAGSQQLATEQTILEGKNSPDYLDAEEARAINVARTALRAEIATAPEAYQLALAKLENQMLLNAAEYEGALDAYSKTPRTTASNAIFDKAWGTSITNAVATSRNPNVSAQVVGETSKLMYNSYGQGVMGLIDEGIVNWNTNKSLTPDQKKYLKDNNLDPEGIRADMTAFKSSIESPDKQIQAMDSLRNKLRMLSGLGEDNPMKDADGILEYSDVALNEGRRYMAMVASGNMALPPLYNQTIERGKAFLSLSPEERRSTYAWMDTTDMQNRLYDPARNTGAVDTAATQGRPPIPAARSQIEPNAQQSFGDQGGEDFGTTPPGMVAPPPAQSQPQQPAPAPLLAPPPAQVTPPAASTEPTALLKGGNTLDIPFAGVTYTVSTDGYPTEQAAAQAFFDNKNPPISQRETEGKTTNAMSFNPDGTLRSSAEQIANFTDASQIDPTDPEQVKQQAVSDIIAAVERGSAKGKSEAELRQLIEAFVIRKVRKGDFPEGSEKQMSDEIYNSVRGQLASVAARRRRG